MSSLQTKERFVVLDGLRGVAALLVVVLHLRTWIPLEVGIKYLAVELFFVLSGFVIAHSYEKRLAEGLTFAQFMRARFVRLYPLYLLGTALGCVAALTGAAMDLRVAPDGDPALVSLPFAAWMSPSPLSKGLYPLNVVAWSLFFELIANALFALTWRAWRPAPLLVWLAFAAIIMMWLNEPEGGPLWTTFWPGLMRVLYSFPAGVLVYRLWSAGWRFRALPSSLVYAAFIAAMWSDEVIGLWGVTFVGLPILVWFAASSRCSFLSGAAAATAGDASYAVYITHAPLILLVQMGLAGYGVEGQAALVFYVFPAAVFALGIVADRVFDRPTRRWLGSKFKATPIAPERA
jgi:peptidoglycan/LPS O-acetylase OafA/YrhL